MVAIPYKVYVVVDRNFGAQLNEIERGVPVWIVESQDNKPVVQRLWQERTFESHFEGLRFLPTPRVCLPRKYYWENSTRLTFITESTRRIRRIPFSK
jgi:hypothetical protein